MSRSKPANGLEDPSKRLVGVSQITCESTSKDKELGGRAPLQADSGSLMADDASTVCGRTGEKFCFIKTPNKPVRL